MNPSATRSLHVSLLSLILTAGLAACYGAAPPHPISVPLPNLSDGAEIAVHTASKTTIENVQKQSSTCPQGHSEGDPACTITRYEVAEPVTRTTTRATYAGAPINYGQFKVLTDAKYDQKLVALDELSHLCHRANTPRYVGIGLLLGGVIAMAVSGNQGAVGLAGWGGIAGGLTSYAFGYYAFGGRKCNEAKALYHELDMSEAIQWESVEGSEYPTEMKTLAEQFNATHGGHASAMRMRHDR